MAIENVKFMHACFPNTCVQGKQEWENIKKKIMQIGEERTRKEVQWVQFKKKIKDFNK